jgi:hypothetical protein
MDDPTTDMMREAYSGYCAQISQRGMSFLARPTKTYKTDSQFYRWLAAIIHENDHDESLRTIRILKTLQKQGGSIADCIEFFEVDECDCKGS